MRKLMLALSAVSLLAATTPTLAAPCKDAKGKFMKCPAKAPPKAAKPKQCRDAKGKFTKCK